MDTKVKDNLKEFQKRILVWCAEMADANDVSFNLIPDEERLYNSNWDTTLKETFRATERDTQGWSALGATGLKARENGRSDAGNEPTGAA